MSSSAILIFLDLPPKTFVGIDLLSFDSSPNFYGISEVPTGLHFVYTGTDAAMSIRHGRWLNIEPGTMHVLRWSGSNEHLFLLAPEDDAVQHARTNFTSTPSHSIIAYPALEAATANVQSSNNLSPLASTPPSSTTGAWPSLTSHISPRTITRILPQPHDSTLTSISSAAADSDADRIPGLSSSEALSALPADSTLNLLPINLKQTWDDGDIGTVRTERARDRSWYLSQLVQRLTEGHEHHVAAREVLGEMQFCFLMVVVLANWSCLEGWKRILGVVCTCRQALEGAEAWFVEVLKVLKGQMERVEDVEGGVFELREESASAWLRELLRRFRGNVEDVLGEGSKLEREMKALEEMMRDVYGWEVGKGVLKRGMVQLEDGEMVEVSLDEADEDEERGDWAPVVVET
jgi:A1 cistron-splicing factor AAR2